MKFKKKKKNELQAKIENISLFVLAHSKIIEVFKIFKNNLQQLKDEMNGDEIE